MGKLEVSTEVAKEGELRDMGQNMGFDIRKQDRILVVAPHPDDESIGCGGLLALYGEQCDVLLLTDGRHGHSGRFDGKEEELIVTREKELFCALKIAQVKNVCMLHVPDGELFAHYSVLKNVDIRPYDYIFVPNRKETHEDHRMSYWMIKKLRHAQNSKAKLAEYEVWTPLTCPTRFLDISSVIERKRSMIEQHESQMMDIDYAGKGIGLSCYRGIYMKVPYAEAYMVEGDVKFIRKVADKIPVSWKYKIKNMIKKS